MILWHISIEKKKKTFATTVNLCEIHKTQF